MLKKHEYSLFECKCNKTLSNVGLKSILMSCKLRLCSAFVRVIFSYKHDLMRGRVSRFSLDALVNIATAIGQRVHVELKAA